MKINRIDHIGIAVNSIENAITSYKLIGFEVENIIDFPPEDVKVCFLKNYNVTLELLEPLSEDSTIKKYLIKKGEGIHHICFEIENFENEVLKLKNIVIKGPRKGAKGKNICFINPRSFNHVLIEFIES
ncbi:MAG: methylmalonyl-CoA epimerase [bacterium]|nr:methylmalonyl-CoA epimerase [bacterium]